MLHRFVIVGADQVGLYLAQLLRDSGRHEAVVADRDPEALALARRLGLVTLDLSGGDALATLTRALSGASALIALRSWWHPLELAQCAWSAGCAYIDTSESSGAAARLRKACPRDIRRPMVLGCGLSPGLASALLAEELMQADERSDVALFVGVLPRVPDNRLGYANIWGVEGLIEEYTEDCLAIADGVVTRLAPLTGLEPLHLGGTTYETFTTAGSIDDLVAEFAGRVRSLCFKTIRYPGHHDYMRFLLDDLGLGGRLYRLKEILQTALPRSHDDLVLVHVRHSQSAGGARLCETRQRTFLFQPSGAALEGQPVTALTELTARHVAAVAELLGADRISGGPLIEAGTILPGLLSHSSFLDLDRMRLRAD